MSLLPDFLASRLSGTLAGVERVVEAAEAAESLEAAVEAVRPAAAMDAVTLPSALRWLRRRLEAVRGALIVEAIFANRGLAIAASAARKARSCTLSRTGPAAPIAPGAVDPPRFVSIVSSRIVKFRRCSAA